MGKLIGWSVVIAMWTGCGVGLQYMANNETINTAEDMIEWIEWDVENGYVDSTRGDTYIDNLEQIIKETR
jgi:hypothetical protein